MGPNQWSCSGDADVRHGLRPYAPTPFFGSAGCLGLPAEGQAGATRDHALIGADADAAIKRECSNAGPE